MTEEEFREHLVNEAEFMDCEIHNESYLCDECGSADIDQQFWVGVNTNMIAELIDPEKWYCNNCEKETEGFTVEVFWNEKMYEKLEVK